MKYLELAEAAEVLKLAEITLKHWIKAGKGGRDFKNYVTKVGRRNVILEENLDRWMRGLPPADWKEA